MNRRLRLAVVLVLLAGGAIAAGAWGHGYTLGDLAIGHIWAPPSEAGAAGAPVYGPILNHGKTAARLVGASTPIAEQVRFRVVKNGVVQWPAAIDLPPGKPIGLAAWREHLWLSHPNRPLREGDSFDLTLDFADAGHLKVTVIVQKTPGD